MVERALGAAVNLCPGSSYRFDIVEMNRTIASSCGLMPLPRTTASSRRHLQRQPDGGLPVAAIDTTTVLPCCATSQPRRAQPPDALRSSVRGLSSVTITTSAPSAAALPIGPRLRASRLHPHPTLRHPAALDGAQSGSDGFGV